MSSACSPPALISFRTPALAVILAGHFAQPAPRLAEIFGYLTWVFGISAGFVFVAGWIFAALRSRQVAPQ